MRAVERAVKREMMVAKRRWERMVGGGERLCRDLHVEEAESRRRGRLKAGC